VLVTQLLERQRVTVLQLPAGQQMSRHAQPASDTSVATSVIVD
jgi:hypothetical protein